VSNVRKIREGKPTETSPIEACAREVHAALEKYGCRLVGAPVLIPNPVAKGGFTISVNVDIVKKA
jgi:hypothetical protein